MTNTYVRGWALVGARAGEGDKFMASLVHDKTADCKEKMRVGGKGEGKWGGGREGERGSHH